MYTNTVENKKAYISTTIELMLTYQMRNKSAVHQSSNQRYLIGMII
jgi:hypothetical protein